MYEYDDIIIAPLLKLYYKSINNYIYTSQLLLCDVIINSGFNNNIYINSNFNNIFIINIFNVLYCCGINDEDSLGLGNDNKFLYDKFIKHPYLNNIKFVSIGLCNEHTFVYNNNNKLYGFGLNLNCELGFINNNNNDPIRTSIPKLININFKLIKISCGLYHSLLLTNNGYVYGCGKNIYGQLGNNNNNNIIKNITKIIKLKNINDINCLENSSIVKTINGLLYSFGSNKYGELGILKKKNIYDINLINIKKNKNYYIKTFSCGKNHIGIITKKYECYMFGFNIYRQCGIGFKNICQPFKLNIINIIEINCGKFHTIIKNNKLNYYSFGFNKNNECLTNEFLNNTLQNNILKKPYLINIKKYEKFLNKKIIKLIPNNEGTIIICN